MKYLFAILAFLSISVQAATLSWTPATIRENGDVLDPSEIAATKLYSKTTSTGTLTLVTTVPAPATTFTVPGCKPLFYVATTVDTGNLESTAPSNNAQVIPVSCNPKAPTGLKVN